MGIDDGAFAPHVKGLVHVIGVVFRGGCWLDGVLHTKVEVDGLDATIKIALMILNSSHYKQLEIIMLNGVTCAGFNVIDIKELNLATRLPVIAVSRRKPHLELIRKALLNLPESDKRWKMILSAGEMSEVHTRSKSSKVYMQRAGILGEDAEKILQLTSTRSEIPEALRVAHLVASGIDGV